MKQKVLILIGIGLVILSFLAYQSVRAKRKGKKQFEVFYASNLNSEISSITVSVGGVYFRLSNDSTQYVFFPRTSDVNGNTIFEHIAERGDLLVKKSYADTLKLVKEDKVYLYTFQKIE
ncbi:MAG TPA: hypothetical protein VK666_30310 [Chryseolinea sp.]|nr:hypothetical protein [Chryseolinea sp.]